MIGSVFIKCNAANPDVPLRPLCAFKGSPSSLRVIDVPRKIGAWQITAVRVTATYPDNRAVAKDAVLTGGAWVATLDAPGAVGEVAGGLVVTADGVDEDGAEVRGYVLGVGDLRVLDRDLSITVGGEVYFLHYFDEIPEEPHKGDMCVIGGALKWWDGDSWELFGAGGDMSHSEFEGLPEKDLDADEVGFPEICEVINKMKNALRPSAIVAALCLAAFGAVAAPSVEKSKLSALKGGSNVVTSVSFDGLATDAALFSASNALAKAISSATPGDYAAVSNKAYAAATQTALDGEIAARQAGDETLATQIGAEAARAKAAEQANADAIAAKADASALDDYALLSSLSLVATSGAYSDLTGTPTIPSKVSELTNDAGYLTSYTETDPLFAAWTNGIYVTLGQYNEAKGDYFAFAIGRGNKANGQNTMAFGMSNETSGDYASGVVGHANKAIGDMAYAFGYGNRALGDYTLALGYQAYASVDYSLAVSQTPSLIYLGSSTTDNGATARSLQSYLDERATTNDVAALSAALSAALDGKADKSSISATDPTFSNAVLSVTTQFDTNTVAQLNELLEEGSQLPTTGVVSVGAALAAFAAALAKLKSNLAATDAKVSAANTSLEEVA